ncbi:MAG: lipoate--protein ligase family protein [Actinomycetota bacterium]
MTPWRYLNAGAIDAPVSFGRMPAIASGLLNGGPEVFMTGMFGRAHFQIGWFEDVDAVIDLDAARSQGIDVFRRPVWGGGTAFYDTNASALFAFFLKPGGSLDQHLERFKPVMRSALDAIGLDEARIEGSSDIRWRGRKLGTVISQDVVGVSVVGGFLNLRKPDMNVYASIARVPPEKFADKEIKDAVEYVCTPGEVRGSDLSYEELRDALVHAASTLIELEPDEFNGQEIGASDAFAATVSTEDWIRRVSSHRFARSAPSGSRVGFANVKGRKLVRAGVALDRNNWISAAMIAGDMHVSPPDAMDRIAAALHAADAHDRADLSKRVQSVFDEPDVTQPDAAAGITTEDVVEAIEHAVKDAT